MQPKTGRDEASVARCPTNRFFGAIYTSLESAGSLTICEAYQSIKLQLYV